MVLFSEFGDLLDHLALLVYLDRVDPTVIAGVFHDADRLLEGFVNLGDTRVQQVAETQ